MSRSIRSGTVGRVGVSARSLGGRKPYWSFALYFPMKTLVFAGGPGSERE